MVAKVALIFGYGPNVGVDVASAFAAKGYQIAVVSRSDKHHYSAQGYLSIQADLSDPSSVQKTFATVVEKLGHPSVVVYNASALSMLGSISLDEQISGLNADNNVNVVSTYVSTQLAIKSFEALPPDASKTFIYTGNKLHLTIVQPLLSAGVGKAGAAHLINYLAEEYKDQGYKFYFADERESNGEPVYSAIDGQAHGEFYTHLAEGKVQGPWNATFVKGQGYVDFHEVVTMTAARLENLG
ncbi:hypothetical protein PT974_07639 [Cladobotryum mycophilum]|uniref:Short-chain dehydrogenase n=1 Tax=Cladobotryum mycophilum TaxID=491253 RepID=A0ABR0SPU6_9HYPO